MEKPRQRVRPEPTDGPGPDPPAEPTPEPPPEPPTIAEAARPPKKPGAARTKIQLTMSEEVVGRILLIACTTRRKPGEVVERLLTPQLAGCRQAAIPDSLRSLFTRERRATG